MLKLKLLVFTLVSLPGIASAEDFSLDVNCTALAYADIGHSPAGSQIQLDGFPKTVHYSYPQGVEINNGDIKVSFIPILDYLRDSAGRRTESRAMTSASLNAVVDNKFSASASGMTQANGIGAVTLGFSKKGGLTVTGSYDGKPIKTSRAVVSKIECTWKTSGSF